MKWVKNINFPALLNYGVSFYKKKEHLVFVSEDINNEPDFTLDIFDSIANNKPALYKAVILKCFGKYQMYKIGVKTW